MIACTRARQLGEDETLLAAMVEAAHKLGETYDAITVDEARDVSPDWWTYLELLFAKPELL